MTQQAPWDFVRMIEIYDRLADERGGWHFEHDRTEEVLRARYLGSPEGFPDLQHFAEGLFTWGPAAEPLRSGTDSQRATTPPSS